ncbi:MAG TPA: 6-oxocyclohex-1-ene-1-carbonyl-CoA hydratase [Casimicrobiaceae bacterium]|nr:6-oxocyclohex-1-ene-1-carbonyl-CoA hydratase [Casimicrobiaceae bacterium]
MKDLAWLPRDNALKDHHLDSYEHANTPPTVRYELRPLASPEGKAVAGLSAAWITLDNPAQYNSYTTDMVKRVTLAFQQASVDRGVVAVVFTGVGDKAFCSGGNTDEYAAYYSRRPSEYGEYVDLFNGMVDGILNCKKPTICRVNGLRVGGGQEIGLACDFTISSDLAVFGQAGPKHGSAPDGGATDFLPWFLSIEDAMYSCVSCESWSAYKMKLKGLISAALPVLWHSGKFVRNPLVRTDMFIDDGEIVYGEPVPADRFDAARALVKSSEIRLDRVDAEVDRLVWKFANLFPGCLMKSIDGIRAKKKVFWDQMKVPNRHWLATNMSGEAFLGFTAFATRKQTGRDVIDFLAYRQAIAAGKPFDDDLVASVLPAPRERT